MRLEHGDLPAEHVFRLPRLALLECLADARDHVQAGVERRPRPQRDALVRLAEVPAPLGMADERAGDSELEQHRRGDLARVRPLRLPVHVLRVRRQPRLDAIA